MLPAESDAIRYSHVCSTTAGLIESTEVNNEKNETKTKNQNSYAEKKWCQFLRVSGVSLERVRELKWGRFVEKNKF